MNDLELLQRLPGSAPALDGETRQRIEALFAAKRASGPSRRRRGMRVGVLAVAAALVAGALSVGIAAGRTETVTVSGAQALRDPRGVERVLAADGIDATILVVPMPAGDDGYWSGRWYSLYFDGATDISQQEFDHLYFQVGRGNGTEQVVTPTQTIGAEQVKVLELPKDLPGHITLLVARTVAGPQPTAAGYDSMNELSPVGSLSCAGLNPDDPSAVGDALAARGYEVSWTMESGNAGQTLSSPPAGSVVTWVWTTGPRTVDVRLTPAGSEARMYQAAEGTFLPDETPPWGPLCA
jgi:hypothetical protein